MWQWWKQRLWFRKQPLLRFVLALFIALLAVLVQAQNPFALAQQAPSASDTRDENLPPLQAHPLPAQLAQWQDRKSQGDYFLAVQPTLAGYLIWSKFPIAVYVEPPASASDRSQAWFEAVTQGIQEWNLYLPLQLVNSPETANIIIWRRTPPLQAPSASASAGQSSGQAGSSVDRLPRARAAETRYHLFVDRSTTAATLAQQFTIQLSPNQPADYTKATARHEFGHALGIWGHSPSPTDVMYFSQVRNPPAISDRDVNTLKRVYEQPTRIGWAIAQE